MPDAGVPEEEKRRRVPGIGFLNSPSGRVACIAGTGVKVWLVIETYLRSGRDWGRLRSAYEHVAEDQLWAALAYYRAFPGEIDERIAANEAYDIEAFWQSYPFTRPPWRRTPARPARPARANGNGHGRLSDGPGTGHSEYDIRNLLRAGEEGRVLVTRDAQALAELTVLFHTQRLPHAGVLILEPAIAVADPEVAAAAIAEFAETHDNMPPYTVDRLGPPARQ